MTAQWAVRPATTEPAGEKHIASSDISRCQRRHIELSKAKHIAPTAGRHYGVPEIMKYREKEIAKRFFADRSKVISLYSIT